MESRFRVVSYSDRQHSTAELGAFRCGDDVLDRYLREYASQDVKRHGASVYLVLDREAAGRIAGFYTLSSFAVDRDELLGAGSTRLPTYVRTPATLVGRLARDERYRGLGGPVLIDALVRAHAASRAVASYAVVVEAKNDHAAAFYRRFGFLELSPRRLFLPMATVAKMIEATAADEAAVGRE